MSKIPEGLRMVRNPGSLAPCPNLWSCRRTLEEHVSITTTRRLDDLYLVELVTSPDVLSAVVSSPRREGMRIFTDVEREVIARRKAQELALEFAEAITDFEKERTRVT